MAFKSSIDTKPYTMGKGMVSIALLDENRNQKGLRFLGNTPGFQISVSTEKLEHYASTGGLRQKDIDKVIQIDRTAQITVDSASIENFALFLAGEVSDVVQASGSVADESITVEQGFHYQLGRTASNKTGVSGVTNVVVQDSSDTTTYVEGTDYEIDLALGMIKIITGGGIADGAEEVLHIDYDTESNTRQQIATSSDVHEVALHYVADNPIGENYDVLIPLASIQPNGDAQFISDELISLTLDIGINQLDGDTAAIYIDKRPIAA